MAHTRERSLVGAAGLQKHALLLSVIPRANSFIAVTFIGFNSRENIFPLQAEEKGEEESIDTPFQQSRRKRGEVGSSYLSPPRTPLLFLS